MTRICKTCSLVLPLEQFRDRPGKRSFICRPCERARDRRVVPCPECGKPKLPRSQRCAACDFATRQGVHRIGKNLSAECPRCGAGMSPRSTMCWDCSIATRSERHKRNTGPKLRPLIEKLLERVVPEGDCLVWTGTRDHHGYGYVSVGHYRQRLVHRVSYELFVGDIPHGLTIDHLCANTSCVNAFHLDVCTQAENSRRAAARRKRLKEERAA